MMWHNHIATGLDNSRVTSRMRLLLKDSKRTQWATISGSEYRTIMAFIAFTASLER